MRCVGVDPHDHSQLLYMDILQGIFLQIWQTVNSANILFTNIIQVFH